MATSKVPRVAASKATRVAYYARVPRSKASVGHATKFSGKRRGIAWHHVKNATRVRSYKWTVLYFIIQTVGISRLQINNDPMLMTTLNSQ